jgi:hypothetical protein
MILSFGGTVAVWSFLIVYLCRSILYLTCWGAQKLTCGAEILCLGSIDFLFVVGFVD